MASNWLQKWWWKIQPPSPGIPFEQGVVEPYLEFQAVLARAQHDIDVQSLAKKNKQQDKAALYAHYAKQVIAYDQRSWLSQSWVWLTGQRPAIDRKRLWCAVYRCQPLQMQVIPLAKMPAIPPRILTPEKIDSMQKLMQSSSEHPALPSSWLTVIKNVVQGWTEFYKSDKSVLEKKTTPTPPSKMANNLPPNPPAVDVSQDQAASISLKQHRNDVLSYAAACGFLKLDPLKLQDTHVDTLKVAWDGLRREARTLVRKNKLGSHSYDSFLKQAEPYYENAKRLLPTVALIPLAQWKAYQNEELFITYFRDGITLRKCALHPLYASLKVKSNKESVNANSDVKTPKPTPPIHTTALMLSAIPVLAQEDPKTYKMLVSNFISACGFYGLDVLRTTPRQVASRLRQSIVALHTDKAEKEAIGRRGKIVVYSKDAQVNYHAHRTEQLTELKTRFDIAGLPPEQVLVPSSLFSLEETWELYQAGHQFRCEFDDNVKTGKVMVCLHSEVNIHSQKVDKMALRFAAWKKEVEAKQTEMKAEFEAGQIEMKAEFEAGQIEMKAEFETGLIGMKAEFETGLIGMKAELEAGLEKIVESAVKAAETKFQQLFPVVGLGNSVAASEDALAVSDVVPKGSSSPQLFQPAAAQAKAVSVPSPGYTP